MFSNDEDDENQFTGLVARGRSTYAPRGSGSGPAPPPTESTTIPALERRTSSAASFPVRTSSQTTTSESHDPYADAEQVNITPLLLKKMDRIMLATSDASRANHINRYQASLASRRMKLISSTLRQMPHPAPSPRLLTALQSLCLLVRQCAYDAADGDAFAVENVLYGPDGDPLGPAQCWPVLLCQHFTCRLLFRGAYRRLWSAWRMYSPTELEHEDAVAEAKDRSVDAEVLLRLLFAADDLSTLETTMPAGTLAQHRRDMLAHYQRHEMSPWRIPLRSLEPTAQRLRCQRHALVNADTSITTTVRSFSSCSSDSAEAEERHVCFRVLPTVYTYNSVPVVVKALCGDGVTDTTSLQDCDATTQAAAMRHAADFLQDALCRCTWCHPHVVGCLGAYTEKFLPDTTPEAIAEKGTTMKKKQQQEDSQMEEAHLRDKSHGVAGTPSVSSEKQSGEQQRQQQQRATLPMTTPAAQARADALNVDLPWSHTADTFEGTPVMALGYITELQLAPDSSMPCLTLGDLLFPPSSTDSASSFDAGTSSSAAAVPHRHYFTLFEALDICAQLADALQYILEDCGDVPAAVRTAWLTLDPFNVYVVRTMNSGGPAAAAAAAALPTISHLPFGREGAQSASAEDRLSRAHSRNSSDVFSAPPSLPETGSVHSKNSSVVISTAASASAAATTEATGAGESGRGGKGVGQSERTPLLRAAPHLTVHVDPAQTFPQAHSSVLDDGGSPLMPDAGITDVKPRRGPQRFVVRYAPPTDWTRHHHPHAATGLSRWRPHPRATAPASYVIAQMLLALLTRQVPYASYGSDAEVQRRVFDIAHAQLASGDTALSSMSNAEAAAAGVRVKLSTSGQGYSLPSSLPPALAQWCRQALSLDRSQPPMELESLRDALTAIQASLPEVVGHAVPASPDAAGSSREMSPRFDGGGAW